MYGINNTHRIKWYRTSK